MIKTKLLSILLILSLLLTLGACSSSKKKETTASPANFLLPFSGEDSTDPYACKSDCNALLSELIYESLFVINEHRDPENLLAQNYIAEDKTITVTLKPTVFSDGSALTSDDVIYSYNRAKQSDRYKAALEIMDNVQAKGSSVVRFTLRSKNVYGVNALTFPIVSQKNNLLGSGYYALTEQDGAHALIYNKNHEGDKPEFETISLVECADEMHAIKLFNQDKIDFVFETLADGNRRTTAIQSQKAKLNNLLFLGLNSKKGLLNNADFRRALTFSISQTALCEEALEGFAEPTATPFDASWSEMGSIVANTVSESKKEAKAAFLASGCTYDKMGINLLSEEKPITLTLLVNSANNMKIALAEAVKTQLIGFGISVEVKKMPLDEYNIAIENENFDMYVGEVKIPNDFNLDCFFTSNGGADFGIDYSTVQKTYVQFRGGNATLQDFVSAFCEENPLIPIGYKYANVGLNAGLETTGTMRENCVFPQIQEWSK